MKYEYGITITTELKLESLARAGEFPFLHVIDARRGKRAKAFPISELIYRRLKNLRVGFDQIPVDLMQPSSREENDLVRSMTEPAGQVLVVTNQVSEMVELCKECYIPVSIDETRVELNRYDQKTGTADLANYQQVA